MPDELPIRITKSAGNTWPTKFGPTPPSVPAQPTPEQFAEDLAQLLRQLGPARIPMEVEQPHE